MPNHFEEELNRHRRRLQDPHKAQHVWDLLLSEDERNRLGSLEVEYQNHQTIGIWMRAKNVSKELAIIQLAKAFGMPSSEYNWMLKALGESVPAEDFVLGRPHWDRERGELTLNSEVIRVIARRNQASNIVAILDAFQSAGWSDRIDDPLPPPRDSERLGQTLRRLNQNLSEIRFSRDGTGSGVRWELLSSDE